MAVPLEKAAQFQPASSPGTVPVRTPRIGLQQFVDSSPRILAQRRAIDAARGGLHQLRVEGSRDSATLQTRGAPIAHATGEWTGSVNAPASRTGMPSQFKAGIESMSGMSMDHGRCQYESPLPLQLKTDLGEHAFVRPVQSRASTREPDGAPAAGGRSVAQAVTMGTLYKSTDGKKYRTQIDDANYVGVLSGATAPQPANWIQSTGTKVSSYTAYKFMGGSFVNDCYEFATKLAHEIAGKTFPTSGPSFMNVVCGGKTTAVQFAVISKPKDTDTAAADGDYGVFALNKTANPTIGQAYTTVPKSGAKITSCNFHVATVVATDGNDRVTCEANAGDATRTEPVFDMYSTDRTSRFTFHGQYATEYGDVLAATGILALP